MACVGGGIDVNWLVLAAACCVRGLVSGGGAGGVGVGVALLVVGGAGVGVVLAGGLGVPVGRVGVPCVCAVRPLRFLTGCGAGVWVGSGCMSVLVGLWSVCNGVAAGRWCSLVWGVGGGAAG